MYELLGIQTAKLIEKNRCILIGLEQHETFIAEVKRHVACAAGICVWNTAENPGEAKKPLGSCC